MHIGFTGTRTGMSLAQARQLRAALRVAVAEHDEVVFHHGDCVGADAQAHRIALLAGCRIVIHPPTKDVLRAFCPEGEVLVAKDYLVRNRDIVNASSIVYAGVDGPRRPRSGTWSTVDYALKRKVSCTVLER